MQSIVEDLIGKEDYMLSLLQGKADLQKKTSGNHNSNSDEEFDDE